MATMSKLTYEVCHKNLFSIISIQFPVFGKVMHTKENYFVVSIVVFVWLYFALTTSYFIAADIFDPTFFTYDTYFANYLFYGFLYGSFYSYPLLQIALLGLFPIVYGMTMFVALAIVFIVWLDDEVYTRAILGGTSRTWGEQFVGDRLIHVVPAVFIFFTLLALYRTAGHMINVTWKTFSKGERAAYLIYVLFVPSVVIGVYMLTMPFQQNYLVPWNIAVVAALSVVLSVALQGVLVGITTLFTHCGPISEKPLHTPMGYYL